VTCAGVLRTALMEDMPIEDFDLVLNVNTRGTFLCAQKALPLLRAGATPDNPSRIVMLSSVAALRPKIVSGAYAASKAAVSQLCRVMAAEWAPSGVLVNALAPGTVDTPMVAAVANPAASKGYRPSGVSPVGRIAQPDDVVDVMMFLLSDAARYVTGTTIRWMAALRRRSFRPLVPMKRLLFALCCWPRPHGPRIKYSTFTTGPTTSIRRRWNNSPPKPASRFVTTCSTVWRRWRESCSRAIPVTTSCAK